MIKEGLGMVDPYEVLGISRASSYSEAQSQYRKLSKLYHPDVIGTGDSQKFQEVSEAWELFKSGTFTYNEPEVLWSHKTLFSFKRRE